MSASLKPAFVRELRRRYGWSRREMAALLHVGLHTVERWERGVTVPAGQQWRRVLELARREAQ